MGGLTTARECDAMRAVLERHGFDDDDVEAMEDQQFFLFHAEAMRLSHSGEEF
jgi:hypothetical protein